MSVKVMAWVWDHSPTEGADRIVLLAIADSADHDGTNAWPSIPVLAQKCRLSERTVQRCVRNLEAAGEIIVERNMGGTIDQRPDRRPNRYSITMRDRAERGDTGDAPQSARGDIHGTNGVTSTTERGDIAVSPISSLTVHDPPPARAREATADQQADHSAAHPTGGHEVNPDPARHALTLVADGAPNDIARRLRSGQRAAALLRAADAAIQRGWTSREVADEVGGDWRGVRDPTAALLTRLRAVGAPPPRGETFDGAAWEQRVDLSDQDPDVAYAALAELRAQFKAGAR